MLAGGRFFVWQRYLNAMEKQAMFSYGLVDHALKSPGAVATTWSHDSHNLLVLGNSVEDMVLAQNRVVHMQGGYVTARQGKVTASAALPVGGDSLRRKPFRACRRTG